MMLTLLFEEPWWGQGALAILVAIGTAVLGWIGFLLKQGARSTDRAIDVLSEHLKDIKPEIRMLRMAINNNTMQHEAALEKAVGITMEEHEKTQRLVREQGDRIVSKIERNT